MTPRRFPPPWTVDEHAEANDDAIEATTTAIRRAARPADLIKGRVVRRQNAKRFAFRQPLVARRHRSRRRLRAMKRGVVPPNVAIWRALAASTNLY